MQCISCRAQMRVILVEQDHGMKAAGYEHRTLECSRCQKTERRLAFSSDRASWPVENWRAVTAFEGAASLSKIYETLTCAPCSGVTLARVDSIPWHESRHQDQRRRGTARRTSVPHSSQR
jgi:hypothetical protein